MITKRERDEVRREAARQIRSAGIHLREDEADEIEIVDFGLSALRREGVQVFTLCHTERIAAKVLVLLPGQTEPEHWHPPVGDDPGKEETIRVVAGRVRFYTPGPDTLREGRIPPGKEAVYTARREHLLGPGDQLTLPPGTKHWFQTDGEGAVMYSFSTCVRDGLDRFSDPAIRRETIVTEES